MSFISKPNAVFSNATKAVNSSVTNAPSGSTFATKAAAQLASVTSFMGDKKGVIIAAIFIILLFTAVIVFIVRELMGRNMYKKIKTLTTQVIKMNEIDTPIEIPGAKLPSIGESQNSEGNQYTVAFWMYLTSYTQTPGFHKMVLYRGDRESVQAANPIIMMDEVSNKLHFVVKTLGSTLSSSDAKIDYKTLKPIVDRNLFANRSLRVDDVDTNKHLVLTINSVPFNRWVHIAMSVKDNVVTLFQDGAIHSIKTTNDFKQLKPVEEDQRGNVKPFFKQDLSIDSSTGSFYVGRNTAVGGRNSYNGFFSKLDFATFAMTVGDVHRIYEKGPYPSTLLQKVGINNYGIRTPVYKMSTMV